MFPWMADLWISLWLPLISPLLLNGLDVSPEDPQMILVEGMYRKLFNRKLFWIKDWKNSWKLGLLFSKNRQKLGTQDCSISSKIKYKTGYLEFFKAYFLMAIWKHKNFLKSTLVKQYGKKYKLHSIQIQIKYFSSGKFS